MLFRKRLDEWDVLFPQLLWAYRGTLHLTTGETFIKLLLDKELRLPAQRQHQPRPEDSSSQHEFVINTTERLEQAHEALQRQQLEIQQDDQE